MKIEIPEISKGNEGNLRTLRRASDNDDLALVVCYDRLTHTYVDAVCALNHEPADDGKDYSFVPLAIMNKGYSFFDRLVPCTNPEAIEAVIEESQNVDFAAVTQRKWMEALARISYLEAHLINLADGVLSKRKLLLSETPTSKYINVPDLLQAIADEAKSAINIDINTVVKH